MSIEGDAIVRLATVEDVPALRELITSSVNRLQAEDYSEAQRQGALGSVFGVDPMLIEDGTYFLVEWSSQICACGGWSRRATPFGSDRSPARDDRMLDPAKDAARIRALFVHPSFARKGLGTLILRACEDAARNAGFRRAELTATLTGTRLFRVHGFVPAEEIEIPLGNGAMLPVLRMTKQL
ncbi:MAG TPA: GNAT family N-acetyltransferase [Bryobacteraceae bacterium]|jgi:N-acetylglutamate synthase-like GNAT family acetyltransferase